MAFKMHSSFESQARELVDEWNSCFSSINIAKFLSSEQLLNEIDHFNSYVSCFDHIELNNYLDWNIAYQKDLQQHTLDGHNFSIFHLLKKEFDFSIHETMHSKLIRFLLDVRETHGLGNIFLLEFLKYLGVDSPEIGDWEVFAEQGKIDLLVQRDYPKSVIIIENKSNWASDQKNQLYRYWYKAIYSKTNKCEKDFYDNNKQYFKIVYLSPNSCKQYEEQTVMKPKNDHFQTFKDLPERIPMEIVNMTFNNEIQDWLNNCTIVIPESNHRMREYILQYQMLCKTL